VRRKKPLRSRTPLQRKKKLKAAGIKTGKPPQRRTPLKRTGFAAYRATKSRLDAQAHAAWRSKVVRGRCVMCVWLGKSRDAHYEYDPHHVLPARYIRRYVRSLRLPADEAARLMRSLLYDPRNGICLDRRCHEKHETAFLPVPREAIPAKAWQFTRELGLEWVLDRLYPSDADRSVPARDDPGGA
jgi:hypothetical protein